MSKEVKFRCDDGLMSALDASVRAEGTTRSAWLKALIGQHVGLEKPTSEARKFGDDDERVQVSVRLR